MLLLHSSPRLLLRHRLLLPPSRDLLPAASASALRLRRSVAVRAEPELSTSAAEPPPGDDGEGDGPVELRTPTLFSIDENPTPLQTATSVLLTGAISVFLFRSIRRRVRRAKELRVRSGGVEKPNNLSKEALEGLRLVSASPIEVDKPPSPVQALLGGIAAGVIALILYKFTTTIEAALNRQTISDSFSVRQITITIRTIINGICYLATFVFGINSIGLVLYGLQLTFASIMGDDNSSSAAEKISEQSNTMASSNSSTDSTSDNESTSNDKSKG
ncbi:uncharacterized protein [Oryza sativa Japonica Group]|uniref:Os02g0307800 protein n=2 Tax=Oryza sativa subsp. japonica TaxID=39947 RepID=Q6Z0W7_ORYSJ|nr:uncharacterized protein LOC4329119 [Oryza sativa Japonica Group]KAB8086981.1 hypothetical protein EE612_010703 [Oryza sativa]EAZ22736.1 hypothetical protein OsJ_06408 [Oryza sativa Japonica Group]KAF2944395.1 hypothetical protein DAI22_02g138900 [Oryza sativa Japonica Group]BAD16208.1 unknown protein [Oryza sativa Japonica Group]BAF08557.1 Os02g0307800 [Oryza sativa Japonica Group]|eukprot:NP_001046643.1 Os02g0307800 [Oryza sativa Japonica Group]